MAADNVENKIDIPVQRTDLILFEDAVSSVKDKFIAEMKKMDEEMNKLSSDLMRLYAQSSTLHAELAPASESFERQSPSKGQANWESLASSPLIEGDGENKTLRLQFDVSQFDPTEVTVRIDNEVLIVSAAHEEKSDTSLVLREFYREFKFPRGVDPSAINSTPSKDGALTVQAPLPQLALTDKTGRCSPKCLDSV